MAETAKGLLQDCQLRTRLQQHDALLFLGQLGGHGGDELVPELAVERVPGHPAEGATRMRSDAVTCQGNQAMTAPSDGAGCTANDDLPASQACPVL